MLELKNIYAGYGQLGVLHGISLKAPPNSIIAIIGPNGAGKSTVIKSICNIAQVTKGTITYNDKLITNFPTHDLIEVGISYVPQGKINFGNLTVKENLEIGAILIADQVVIQTNLAAVYKKFPVLRQRQNTLAYSLSGGQRQMLALGRALMQNPTMLLLDEPSLGLSPKLQKELFKTIQKLKADGISIIIVEQNAKKAIEIADQTYLLEDGKIVLKGAKEILTHKQIRNVYLGGR